jgi:hypothetical protein
MGLCLSLFMLSCGGGGGTFVFSLFASQRERGSGFQPGGMSGRGNLEEKMKLSILGHRTISERNKISPFVLRNRLVREYEAL